jgi:non-specific protein-tyrosine kinase
LGGLFSARQIADVQIQIAALESKRNTLQANYAALLANTQQGAINALNIIENAAIPTNPISSNKTTTILTSAAIGFVLAVSAAYFLEYLDDSVKSVDDVKKAGDISTLASIPNIRTEQDTNRLITTTQPRSPVSEIYRILRTNIHFSRVDNPPRKLLITSPNPGEGKTTITANLAAVIAQAGHKVLLLDADLRRPMQHVVFGLNSKPGLTELLLEENLADESDDTAVVEKFIQKTGVSNLDVLVSGTIPHNPSELLGSFRMKAALDLLSTKYDFLIIDSPPVLALADSLILSAQIDGVILVAQANRTKRRQLKLTVEKLREVDAPLVGVTLNRGSQKEEGYSYYYYQSDKNQESAVSSRKDLFNLNGTRVNGLLSNKGRTVEMGSEETS